MQNIELTYEATGTRNYLQATISEEVSSYQLKMLENNQITGFLSVHSRVLNGKHILAYDITGMSRIKDCLERRRLSEKAQKELLYNILNAIATTEEYLLSYTQCVLNKEYLYCSEDGTIGMLYLPLKNQEVSTQEQIRAFYQDILVNYLTAGGNSYFLELMRYSFAQDFSVAGLMKRLKEEVKEKEEQGQVRESYTNVQTGVLSEPKPFVQPQKENVEKSFFNLPKVEKKAEEPKEPKADSVIPEDNPWGGIAIPGGVKVAQQPEKKEEKSSLFGKLMDAGKKDTSKKEGKKEAKKEKGGLFLHKKKEEASAGFALPSKDFSNSQSVHNNIEETAQEPSWRGTVIITNEGMTDSKTVVLGANSASAYLRHKGESIPMQYFPFSIGRENTDYVIHKNVISRPHAKITKENGTYFICDENSANHTYVNGKQIAPYTNIPLSHGDRLRLADEEMTFIVESGE